MAEIIDGKAVAAEVRDRVRDEVAALNAQGRSVGLAVVLVGEDPASQVYVRNKARTCRKLGIESWKHELPADTSQAALLGLVQELNRAPEVHGILVQLPLPRHIDSSAIIEAIAPSKDVDGLHPMSLGLLAAGNPSFVPCTPAGVMYLLDRYDVPLEGARAVVIGRSNLVGKPAAFLLLHRHATVTMCHSRTKDLPKVVGDADIVVAAAGSAGLVRGEWIRPGATVIDVGTNRADDGSLVGDVEFEAASERAARITPVPKGVGPMTIAMLMSNTLQAARGGS